MLRYIIVLVIVTYDMNVEVIVLVIVTYDMNVEVIVLLLGR